VKEKANGISRLFNTIWQGIQVTSVAEYAILSMVDIMDAYNRAHQAGVAATVEARKRPSRTLHSFRKAGPMQKYKNYPVYATAVRSDITGWDSLGIVFDPNPKVTREIQRLRNGDSIYCFEKQEAERFAQILCEAWIDGLDQV
jgi:hypothetical protein